MKKRWWRSLRFKIIAWSFVPTVIILSAVAWFTFYSYQRVIGDLAIKQDAAIVQTKTMPIFQAFVNVFQSNLITVLMNIDTHLEDPIAVRAQRILDQARNLEMYDGGIYFVDQQGKVIKTWPEQARAPGPGLVKYAPLPFYAEPPGQGCSP